MKREAERESVHENIPHTFSPSGAYSKVAPSQRPSSFIGEICDARRLKDQVSLWMLEEKSNMTTQPDHITETVLDTLTTVMHMIENNIIKEGGISNDPGDTEGHRERQRLASQCTNPGRTSPGNEQDLRCSRDNSGR